MERLDRLSIPSGGPPKHLQGLLEFIDSTSLCNPRQAREMASAIRSFGAWTGRSLAVLPTDLNALRRHLSALYPEALGVSRGRFANVKALLNKALVMACVKPTNRSVAAVLSPAWTACFVKLDDRYLRTSLTPFARFCSAAGIEPDGVSDAVADCYLAHLEMTALVKKPATTHQTVCRVWNKVVGRVAGWPPVRLVVPNRAQTYTLPLTAFPQSFQDELEDHLQRISSNEPIDLLDDTLPLRPLRAASIHTRRYQIRQLASALVHQGIPIEDITALSVLARPALFRLGLRYLLARPRVDMTSTKSAGYIAHSVRSIAKYHLRLPEADLVLLNSITTKLSRHTPGMTEKNRQRLAPFNEPAVLGRFLDAWPRVMRKMMTSKQMSRREAVTFSLCLALDILIHAPVRVKNLSGLRLDTQVRLATVDEGETVILVPIGDTKNSVQLQHLLPPETTVFLRYYLAKVRPLLDAADSAWLFPNGRGHAKRSDTWSKQIAALVKDRLGLEFNPHLERHLTALMRANEEPGDIDSSRRILGHKSAETTFKFYDGFQTNAASRRHGEMIRSKRKLWLKDEKPVRRRGRRAGPRS